MENEGFMSLSEVAQYLGIKSRTIYQYAQSGEIPATKIFGQWKFKKDRIDKWIDSNSTGGFWDSAKPTKSEMKRSLISEIENFITDEVSKYSSTVIGNGIQQKILFKKISDEFHIIEDSKIIKDVIKNLKNKKIIKIEKVKVSKETITMLKKGGN